MSIFGVEGIGDHLELGDAVGTGTLEVQIARVIRRAEPVDDILHAVRRSASHLEVVERIAVRSRRQESEREDIPAGIGLPERERENRVRLHLLRDLGGILPELRCGRSDLHLLADGPDLHGEVGPDSGAAVQDDSVLTARLNPCISADTR